MEKFLDNTPVPWVKVTNPSTGEIYYSTATHEYGDGNGPDPTPLDNIITPTDSGSFLITSSFRSPTITFTKGDGSTFDLNLQTLLVDSASYALTASYASQALSASYATNHNVITSSYICEGILSSNQTFVTASDVKILFVRYDDPNGWITSNQFQPTIAGYYNISFGVWVQNPGISSNQVNTQMRKNGNTMIISQQPLNNGTGIGLGGSRIIQMNGTTDYIDWTIFQGAGSSANGTILQGTVNGSGTWFSAFLITQ